VQFPRSSIFIQSSLTSNDLSSVNKHHQMEHCFNINLQQQQHTANNLKQPGHAG